jgi:hypothetical protein
LKDSWRHHKKLGWWHSWKDVLIISPKFPSATLSTPFPFPLDIITLLMILLQLPLIATDAIAAANETLMMIILRASDAIAITN